MGKYYILVEGKTDKEVLDFYIEQAYPELQNYFYIVPFERPNRTGGKDYISHIVKAIIHLEEQHKNIVAIFDNDTAGISTKELLLDELKVSNIDMYKNFIRIKILSYPNITFLEKYPVHNTNINSSKRIENDNINGRAASIELYLPTICLTNSQTNALFPIRWMRFDEKVYKYQGSFPPHIKDKIMEKFRELKKSINNKEKLFNKDEWSGCDSIITFLLKEIKK